MPVTVHPAPANGTSGVADTAYLSTLYVPNGSYQSGSGFTPNANVAMYCPIRLPSCSIDRLGVFIQVAGTAGAIEAILALAVGFGLNLSTEQLALIMAAVTAVLALVVRSQVTPNAKVPPADPGTGA